MTKEKVQTPNTVGTVEKIGDRFTLTVSVVYPAPIHYRADLLLMDELHGDHLIASFKGETELSVRRQTGKYLRELGRLVDEIPTVTCIDFRNDSLMTHIEVAPENDRYEHIQNPEPFDLLKVMVQLEHEGPAAPLRTIHHVMLDREAFSQNVHAGAYALGFASKPEDPVSRHHRELNAASASGRPLATPPPASRSRASRRARRP